MPHLVKIGMTGRNPKTRAAELTRATGVPAPFAIAWQRAVSDCAAVEVAVHRLLADRRVSQGREFFRCDETMARQVIEAAAGALLRPWYVWLWRSAFLTSPPGPARRYRGRFHAGASDGAIIVVVMIAMVSVAVLKPMIPGWVPGGVARSLLAIERVRASF